MTKQELLNNKLVKAIAEDYLLFFHLSEKIPKSLSTIWADYVKSSTNNDNCYVFGGSEGYHRADCPNAVKKDWEITAYRTVTSNHIYYKQDDGTFFCIENDRSLFEKYFIPNTAIIYIVKRLSDGAYFTIGDKTFSHCGPPKKIKSFRVLECNIIVEFENAGTDWQYLSELKHPTCLFTTEDGKDLFEGDNYLCVRKDSFYSTQGFISSVFKPNADYIYFSTKEAVDRYILQNKPCLSLKEIDDIIMKWDAAKFVSEGEYAMLENLIKSKLK